MRELRFTVTTESNLLIGGNEGGFEIGGVDQSTVVDHNGFPYIPGSSFKGAFRKVVKEYESSAINRIYKLYLERTLEKTLEKVKNTAFITLKEDEKNIDIFFKNSIMKISTEYLFGIDGFNQAPRLLFSDLYLVENLKKEPNLFSIDSKNTIKEEEGQLEANPRTYKVARKGLTFTGTIQFYNFHEFNDEQCEIIEKFIIETLNIFNNGVARLGNSKSRGYGKIKVDAGGDIGAGL